MKKLLILALALLAPAAFAQTANIPGSAALSWTLPTQATDGSALAGPQALTKIQVFVSQSPIADNAIANPLVELPGTATAYTWSGNVANGSTLYARVKACNVGGCSAFSAQGSKQFQVATPSTPGAVSVTVTIVVQASP